MVVVEGGRTRGERAAWCRGRLEAGGFVAMHDGLPAVGSPSDTIEGMGAMEPAVPRFESDHDRREWLIDTLGESFCREIGLYRIPASLVLSVVIPVYNEKKTI